MFQGFRRLIALIVRAWRDAADPSPVHAVRRLPVAPTPRRRPRFDIYAAAEPTWHDRRARADFFPMDPTCMTAPNVRGVRALSPPMFTHLDAREYRKTLQQRGTGRVGGDHPGMETLRRLSLNPPYGQHTFKPESVFTIIPESCSGSPGIAFGIIPESRSL
jgi:hypothetical protein